MKKFIYFLLFFFASFVAKSQVQRPANSPSPNSPTGYSLYGYVRADSGFIWKQRDTFPAKFPTIIWHTNGNFYKSNGNGGAWSLFASSTAGTVSSVSGNSPISVANGTTTPTISVDTSYNGLTTKKWLYKSIDSLGFLKLNISDTAAMLLSRLKVSDTSFMLSGYLRKGDTSAMLSNYVPTFRTINTNAPLFGGGNLTTNRTLGADTGRNAAQLVTGGSLTAVKDSLVALIASSGGGTVLSVATTDGVGIVSSVANSTSTPNISLRVDTVSVSTRAWRQKGIDSVQNNLTNGLALKLNISDTAAMLSNRLKISDTAFMLMPFMQYSDTSYMLSPYRRTSTKITNSDLVNSTISGVALGGTLNALTFGQYLQVGASSYDGSVARTITTNATSTNVGSTLVARDINGDFSARNISATNFLGTASTASTVSITNDVSTNATYYPMFSTVTTGSTSTMVSSSKLTYNPSTGALSSTIFIGNLTGNATTASTLQTPRTINGVAFDGSANITISASVDSSLTAGYGIIGSPFDGSLGRTWIIDTSVISTKDNVTGLIVGKLNISDTASMLSGYLRLTGGTLTGLTSIQSASNGNTIELFKLNNSGSGANTKAKLTFLASSTEYGSIIGGFGASTATMEYNVNSGGNHIFLGGDVSINDDLGVTGLIATSSRVVINGATDDGFSAFKATGKGIFSGSLTADSVIKAGGTSSQFLKADGSIDGNSYKTVADTFFTTGYTTRARTKQVIDSLGAVKANTADLFVSQTILFTDAGWNIGKTTYTFPTPVSSASYNIFNNTINRYLLSSEYTATTSGFTLTSAAQTGDVFVLTGALGTLGNYYSRTEIPPVVDSLITVYNDSVKQLSSVKLQARIDRMRKRLTSLSNLEVGLLNFWDIGITQSNPDSLLFWHDGTITWPLKKVNPSFNTAWEEGGITYVDSLGNRWKSISVVKMHDYTLNEPTNEYYVRYATGTDDTTKGTLAEPFKRLSYAFSRAVTVAQRDGKPFNIKLLDDWIGADGALGGSPTLPNGVRGKITGTPLSGIDKTRLVGQRESYTDATFAWYSLGGGVWACSTASINNATKMTAMGFDLLYRDADSAPLPMRYIAPQASAAATIDSIAGKPSSFGYYTDGGVTTLYVHLIDGRVPSVDNWVYEEGIGSQLNFLVGMGSGMILENIERYYTTTGVQLAAVRARPITVPAFYQENTGEFWIYNCGIYGSAGQGYQLYDIKNGGTEYMVCKYVREDAENYHSFNLQSYTPSTMGAYINYFSNFSVSEHLAENWFRDMPTIGVSTQAISAHDKTNLISLNSVGGYSNGAVAAHVSGAQATHINTHYYYPLQAPSLGPPGSGSPKVVFWADSDGFTPVTKFNIIGGSGNNFKTSNIFSATNNGQIYYFNQKGKTTTETYNGGTITNLY